MLIFAILLWFQEVRVVPGSLPHCFAWFKGQVCIVKSMEWERINQGMRMPTRAWCLTTRVCWSEKIGYTNKKCPVEHLFQVAFAANFDARTVLYTYYRRRTLAYCK